MNEENRKLSEEEVKQVSGGTGTEQKKNYRVMEEECVSCAACLGCPTSAIDMDINDIAVIDYQKCDSCGACVDLCPVNAIKAI